MKPIVLLLVILWLATFPSLLFAKSKLSCDETMAITEVLGEIQESFDQYGSIEDTEEVSNLRIIIEVLKDTQLFEPTSFLENIDLLEMAWDDLNWKKFGIALADVIIDLDGIKSNICEEEKEIAL